METAKSRKGKLGWRGGASGEARTDTEAAEVDESRKRVKVDTGLEDDATGADLEAVAENSIRTVSTSDPVKDFEAMMRNREVDLTDNAVAQMTAVITRFVFEGFGDQFYDRAVDCLRSLRKACAMNDESESFNGFLRNLRDECVSEKDGKSKVNFWNRLVDENITLITTDEAQDSETSAEEAAKFLQKVLRKVPEQAGTDVEAQEDDDLMGLLE